jgi:hypothetical protein
MIFIKISDYEEFNTCASIPFKIFRRTEAGGRVVTTIDQYYIVVVCNNICAEAVFYIKDSDLRD